MQIYIGEEELYTDLTKCLTFVRLALSRLCDCSPQHPSTSQTPSSARHIIEKYSNNPTIDATQITAVYRFFSRVREIISRMLPVLTQNHKMLLLPIKKIELACKTHLTSHNYGTKIGNLLKKVNNLEHYDSQSQLTLQANRLELSAELLSPTLSQRSTRSRSAQSTTKITASQAPTARESEVDVVMRNAQRYQCMNLDTQHYRGRYFDIKDKEERVFQDALARNRFIRAMMMAFHRQYQKYQAKSAPQTPYLRSRTEKKPRLVRTAWQSRAKKAMTTLQVSQNTEQSICHSSRYTTLQAEKASEKSIQPYGNLDGFRRMLEGKISDKKSNAAKVNNIVMLIGSEPEEKVKTTVKKTSGGINSKRWQFFKKSQEQVKKYKKPMRESTLKASIKFRVINPQSTFATIQRGDAL